MSSAPFVGQLAENCSEFAQTLHAMKDILTVWPKCQSAWQQLESNAKDAEKVAETPQVGEHFHQVDKTWRELMDIAKATPGFLALARNEQFLEAMQRIEKRLDDVKETVEG